MKYEMGGREEEKRVKEKVRLRGRERNTDIDFKQLLWHVRNIIFELVLRRVRQRRIKIITLGFYFYIFIFERFFFRNIYSYDILISLKFSSEFLWNFSRFFFQIFFNGRCLIICTCVCMYSIC